MIFIFAIIQLKLYTVRGSIYLIPVTLGGDDYRMVIPENVITTTKRLRFFIVENIRNARRHLRLIDKWFPIDDTIFYEMNEHTAPSSIAGYLDPLFEGHDMGIMSDSGLPGIADPGAQIIELAHKNNIKVIPLAGPSSIIMALIASGLNGQNFCFNGYLPVKQAERNARLRELEKKSDSGYTQIFMETPYRNQKVFESIMATCHPDKKLCIASDITLKAESIRTMKISAWKKKNPILRGKPVIFVM